MSYVRLSFNQAQQHNLERLNIDNCIGRTTYVIIYSPFIKGSYTPFRAIRSLVEILACEDLEQRVWLTEAAFGFNE